MKNDLRILAINLREQGLSHSEIRKKLGVSKSTSSLWTKDVKLPIEAQNILNSKAMAARKKGRDARSKNLKSKYKLIENLVQKDLTHLHINKTFARILCAMLYWGEGSKASGRVVFTNSDPQMIKVFLKFFRDGFEIDENKLNATLHLHPYHNEVIQKNFWSKVTGIDLKKISIYHKKSYGHIIRKNYPGCIAINYGNMEMLNKLIYYYKYIGAIYGGVV